VNSLSQAVEPVNNNVSAEAANHNVNAEAANHNVNAQAAKIHRKVSLLMSLYYALHNHPELKSVYICLILTEC
jgi:hypothetical protein